jgi:uncharacterized membrane protein
MQGTLTAGDGDATRPRDCGVAHPPHGYPEAVTAAVPPAVPARTTRRPSLVTGAMLGVGTMAAVDVVVFHLMLGWHHFYDRSTPAVGLLSDGLLQTGYLVLLVAGAFRLADSRRAGALFRRSAVAGFVTGLGAFQLFDGLVDHKLLRVHQVRYGVDVLPYDVGWIGASVLLLLAGGGLVLASRDEGRGAR